MRRNGNFHCRLNHKTRIDSKMNKNKYEIQFINEHGNIADIEKYKDFNDAYLNFNGINFKYACDAVFGNRSGLDKKYLYDNEIITASLIINDEEILALHFSNNNSYYGIGASWTHKIHH